jgi:RND family efflux transporter MFP subunit
MRRTATFLLRAVLGALLLTATLAVSGTIALTPGDDAAPEPVPPRIPAVRVSDAVAAPPARELRLHATVRAADRALVAFAQPGRLTERPVQVGDRVAAGDRIATLDEEPLRNQVRSADAAITDLDAQLEQLENERARARRLVDAEVGSAATVERLDAERRRLEAARDAASAQRAEARRLRRETTIASPVSGTVAEVYAEPGEVVAAGTPVALIIGEGAAEVEVDVPEAVFAHLAAGDAVLVDFPLSQRRDVPATVGSVGRASAGRGRLFPVVVALPGDAGLVPGMAAEVRIAVPVEGEVAVPVAALVDSPEHGAAVFRVADGRAQLLPVRVSGLLDGLALLSGAVRPGEALVVAGQAALQDGSAVEAHR